MKIRTMYTVMIVIGISAIATLGQRSERPFATSEEAFAALEQRGSLQKPSSRPTEAAKPESLRLDLPLVRSIKPDVQVLAGNSSGRAELLSPGKGAGSLPPFFVQCDKEITENRQRINCHVMSLNFSQQPFIAYGRLYLPDATYRCCGDIVPVTVNMGSYGLVPNGSPYFGYVFEAAFSKEMGQSDRPGDYLFEIVIVDTQGNLIVQNFNPFYHRVTGFARRSPYAINDYTRMGSTVVMSGRFPVNTPVFALVGKVTGNWLLQQVTPPSYNLLVAQAPPCFNTGEQFADITMADNLGSRYTITKSDAFINTCSL